MNYVNDKENACRWKNSGKGLIYLIGMVLKYFCIEYTDMGLVNLFYYAYCH